MHDPHGPRQGMRAPWKNFQQALSRQWVLVSPSHGVVPKSFSCLVTDSIRRDKLLAQMQKLRGSVYLEDGAIQASHLIDGKHRADVDPSSWHLLVVDDHDRVYGCVRFHAFPYNPSFSQLNISRSVLARSGQWGHTLEAAVEEELSLLRRMNLLCVEMGGGPWKPRSAGLLRPCEWLWRCIACPKN